MLEQQGHTLVFNTTNGILGITHLHPNVHEELLLRAGLVKNRVNTNTISNHHRYFFCDNYVKKQKKYCDVLSKHKRTVTGDHVVLLEMADIKQPTEMYVTALETEDDLDFSICETPRRQVSLSLEAAGVSPIHLHATPQHAQLLATQVKLSKVVDKLQTDISGAYQIHDSGFSAHFQ
ncbi:unnamed protein product [Lepeophtheirus salmonis]|uniref:(salmon louse) hypothetical protein n=1 Tax=Lepeophtheirus salmonis TaxID=72036 RepID=A0A7R8HDY8_LEPSM|nr:unnamed protein product [Lepeophtheirus salmonis]CAF3033270.1 unnamed protein product [Lepeophtheirus salmonis]